MVEADVYAASRSDLRLHGCRALNHSTYSAADPQAQEQNEKLRK